MNTDNINDQVVSTETQQQVGVLAQPEVVLSSEPSPNNIDDFRKYLADDVRAHPALANFKDINGLVKSYLSGQSVIGRRIEDLTPEQLADVYFKVGIPNSPDEYELPNVPLDHDDGKWIRETAHKLGLTKQTAKQLLDEVQSRVISDRENNKVKMGQLEDQYLSEIKQTYGPNLDEAIQLAQRGVRSFDRPGLVALMSDPRIGNHPEMVHLFREIGKMRLEHQAVSGGQSRSSFKLTSEEAVNEIGRLNTDPEFQKAYLNHKHPAHNDAVARKKSLYELAYND